ncbi:MAG: NAD-dependent epimerase/dehydratase family protein [Bacteroidetes bacterium]|nr:NAD-dependent epimerase/dehydratase family protein [Bacteroidota bacterium]
MNKHILITGGAGFVGRNQVKKSIAKFPEYTIWVLDNLSTGLPPEHWPELQLPSPQIEGIINTYTIGKTVIKFIHCDVLSVFLSELNCIPQIFDFKLPQFERIYHYASIVGGRMKIDGDPLSVGLDLSIDASFFLWCVKVNHPDRVMYASSSAAYPIGLQTSDTGIALKEQNINFETGFAAPDFTYGWSKLTGEYLSRIAYKNYGLKVAVVRPFSGYGEWQEPVYPAPAIALRAAAMHNPLFVWGTGEQSRDFVHIDDCIRCIELAIENIEDGTAVNIGSGIATSFLQLAALMAKIVGYNPKIVGRSGKPVGVASRYSDPSFTYEKLGFKTEISIEEGMSRVIEVARQRIQNGIQIPE